MRISSIDHYLSLSPAHLAHTVVHCPHCARDHAIPFKEVHHGHGSLQALPGILHRCLGKKPSRIGLIYDKAIEELIRARIIPAFGSLARSITPIPLGANDIHLEPVSHIAHASAADMHPSVEILIGAGSGVICDLTKFISEITSLPSVICGTAVSMNAYTSNSTVITENNFKISKFVKASYAVVMDAEVLSTAPPEMTLAGLGDLTARSICNADFLLSHLLKGTYFCPLPFHLTARFEKQYLSAASNNEVQEPHGIDLLAEADLVSGYSMTMLGGETFPSSGAEHVLSHFWDLQHEIVKAPKNLHGAQVAVGTLINLAIYAYLRQFRANQFSITNIIRSRPSLEQLCHENLSRFGSSGEYLNQILAQKWLVDEDLEAHLKHILADWEIIWQRLDPYIASLPIIRSALTSAGAPATITMIHRTPEQVEEALVFGNRYRKRYTVLDLLFELGLMPQAIPDILRLSGVVPQD